MRQNLTYFLIFVALFAIGCGSNSGSYQPQSVKPVAQAAVRPGDEANLFPLKEGNQWTYTVESATRIGNQTGSGRADMVFKVVKVTPTGDGVVANIEVKTSTAAEPSQQVWEVNKRGIYQRSVDTPPVPFTPMQPVVLFPLEPGRKFSWKGTGITAGGKLGTSTINSTILPLQEVDGESGRYSAVGVESRGTFANGAAKGQMASLAYWSPGSGLVRYRHEVAYENRVEILTLKLKTKSVR